MIELEIDQINALPDLCLLAIFDRIPICDVLTKVNRVSRRWHSLLPSATARRQHHPLILVQSKNDFERSNGLTEYEPYKGDLMNYVVREKDGLPVRNLDRIKFEFQNYAIVCRKFSTKACERLISLLPNLTSLHFIQLGASLSQIVQINLLLFEWKSSLVQLKLWFWPANYEGGIENDASCREHFRTLFDSINSLSSLKNLDLNLRAPSYTRAIFCNKLPIVFQLEQLKITVKGLFEKNANDPGRGDKFSLKSLKLYGEPSLALNEIFFGDDVHATHQMHMFNQFSVEFAKSFIRISELDSIDSRNRHEFSDFFRKFSSLRCVNFRMSRISIGQLASVLSHLPHLDQLGLTVSLEEVPHVRENFPIDEDEDDPQILSIFNSVKTISIQLTSKSHTDFESFQLHRIFPSVQVIRFILNSSRCSLCDYGSHNRHFPSFNRVQMMATATECVKQSLMPLKQFDKLRKVIFSVLSPANTYEKDCSVTAKELFTEFGI